MLNQTISSRSRLIGAAILSVIATTILLINAAGFDALVFSGAGQTNGLVGRPQADLSIDVRNRSSVPVPDPSPGCVQASSGIISWWSAENNPGDRLNRNNGVLQGNAGFVAGKVGKAFDFDGAGDFVQVAAPVGLPIGNSPRTVELWFKTPQVGTSKPIFQYGTASDAKMFGLITGSSGHLHFYGHNNDLDGSTVLQSDTWYHGAVTYDGINLKLYLNGQIEGQGSYPLVNTVLNANGITIGARAADDTWIGQIDEPTIYDHALTQAEIQSIYESGITGKCSICTPAPEAMVSWWPGDGNANDVQGTNHGTLMNGAAFAPGKVGQAFTFDGSDDYVNAGNINLANRSFSFDAWVKRNSSNSADLILGQGTANIGQGLHIGWRVGSNDFTFDFFNSTLNVADTPDGNWHHWAGSYNVTNGEKRLYKDGQLVGASSGGGYSGGGPLWMGRSPWVNGDWVNGAPLDGLMDEVEVFDRVVSQSEFQAIYNAGSAGKCRSQCTPPPPNMISWWPGDGNAFDIKGYFNGTLFGGTTYVAGKVGQAFSFDGTDDYVNLPDMPDLNFGTGEFTIEFWERSSNSSRRMNALAFLPNYPESDLVFDFNDPDPPAPGLWVYWNSSGGNLIAAGSPGAYTDGQWHHVALTREGTTLTLFVDGAATGSAIYAEPINLRSSTNYFGTGPGGGSSWDGQLDEVGIYNRALDPSEIQNIYNAGNAGKCVECTPPPPNMISWWTGDGNAYDIQGSNHGTLMNGAAFAPGKVGQAFNLDGSDDYVAISNTASLDLRAGDFTVDLWVKFNSLGADQTLFHKVSGTGGVNAPSYFVEFALPNTLRFRIGESLSVTNDLIVPTTLATGVWYHIAAVRNGDTSRIYLDGNLIGSQTAGNNIDTGIGGSAVIGRCISDGSCTRFVNGFIDELGVSNRALSQTEIQAIVDSKGAGKCRPALGKAYVPNGGGGTVSVIDLGTGAVDATITAGTGYGFVAIKNDGSKAYVSGAALSKISVIDTSTNTLLTEFTLPGATHGLAADLAGTRLYVAQEFGNSVWVLDADSGALLATIPIGANPFGVAVAPDGSRVYTSNYSNGSVSAIRTSDNSVVTIPTGSFPYGIAVTPDSSRVYVANYGSNTVSVIDATTATVVAEVAFQLPTGIAVNKAGTRVYVGSDTNDILSIDTSNNIGSLIPVNRKTMGISVSPDGSRVAAAARTNNQVVVVNTVSNSAIDIAVGEAPHSLGLFIAQGLTATSPPMPDSCIAKPAGITHWWRGQGNALDTQKRTHATLVNHTTYVPGIVGKAFSFDGVDDHASAPAFDMGANWTVEGWIDPAACSDNMHCPLFARSNGNFDGMLITYLGAGHPRNNELAFDIGNGSDWQLTLNSTAKYSIGSWRHVAATKSGDTYTLYVDGVQRAQQTLAGVSTQYQARDVWLGRWNYGTNAYLQGMIDEVAVYNRALSPAEIAGIYFSNSYGKCAGGMTNTDLDGDMSTDLTIYRPAGASGSEWWTLRSSTGGNWAATFGAPTDKVVAEDFTGDGKTDVAIYRPSNNSWYILRSEDYSYYSFPFGTTGDIPVPADYDGDGIADPAVYRPSTGVWYIARSTGGLGQERFGFPTDKPVPADYDGDGRIDIAIYRPSNGQWWLNRTNEGLIVHTFGNESDYNVPGDFTGDGKADVAIWRPSDGNWYILRSEDYSYYSFPFGAAGDIPAAGDFDGDAVFDAAVFRPSDGRWYLRRSTAGITIIPFGAAGDIPIPGAFIR